MASAANGRPSPRPGKNRSGPTPRQFARLCHSGAADDLSEEDLDVGRVGRHQEDHVDLVHRRVDLTHRSTFAPWPRCPSRAPSPRHVSRRHPVGLGCRPRCRQRRVGAPKFLEILGQLGDGSAGITAVRTHHLKEARVPRWPVRDILALRCLPVGSRLPSRVRLMRHNRRGYAQDCDRAETQTIKPADVGYRGGGVTAMVRTAPGRHRGGARSRWSAQLDRDVRCSPVAARTFRALGGSASPPRSGRR